MSPFRDTGYDFSRDNPTQTHPPTERLTAPVTPLVETYTRQLIVSPGHDSVSISVLEVKHTNRGWRGTPKMLSLRQIHRAEWDTDPVGCLAEELALITGPSPDQR